MSLLTLTVTIDIDVIIYFLGFKDYSDLGLFPQRAFLWNFCTGCFLASYSRNLHFGIVHFCIEGFRIKERKKITKKKKHGAETQCGNACGAGMICADTTGAEILQCGNTRFRNVVLPLQHKED